MVPISGLALVSVLFLTPPVTPATSNDKGVTAVADAYTAAMLKGDVAGVMAVYGAGPRPRRPRGVLQEAALGHEDRLLHPGAHRLEGVGRRRLRRRLL